MLELAKIGFADIRDVVAWRSNLTEVGQNPQTGEPEVSASSEVVLVDSAKLDDTSAAAIAEVSQTKDGAQGEDAQQAGGARHPPASSRLAALEPR